jgi:hypothetical protein
MRAEITQICIEALRRAGHPDATAESVRTEPGQRAAFLELLRACRPLPVIGEMIAELELRNNPDGNGREPKPL